MNRRLLLRVTVPAVAVGLLFFAACLLSIRYIHRLQANLADILAENVASLQAVQELQIRVRQLRHHSLLYLLDPQPERLGRIALAQQGFEDALQAARDATRTREEQTLVRAIEAGYRTYLREQERLRAASNGRPAAEVHRIADTHPIQLVVDPCQELLRVNREKMQETADESLRVSREGYAAMIFLGLAGPVGGLIAGYGITRGLRQSLYRLSVRVQDIAQHLDRDFGSVSVVADGDLHTLEEQMQYVVQKVEQAARQLQRQQRELIRAEQLALLGQLAAGVAHEVRNPLTGIKLLVEAALRPRQAEHVLAEDDLRVVHREVLRLERTVQDFLNFARLPTPEVAPCDFRDVVRQAWELVQARARQQRVEPTLTLPAEPTVVAIDAGQMTTVLVNLFLNALDVLPRGGTLAVELARADGATRLSVCDNGPGIPAAVLERLFQPFNTDKAHGTGLGLSLSGRILEEHGGTLTGQNRPEGGACFVLTLPAAAEESR